jgi:putative ABC transport system permease protein
MDTLRQDIRYALRRLLKSPGFTIVAVVTLALGIGANTAIFSVVNGVILRPLPYHESDRLVGIYHLSEGRRTAMSGPNFMDVRKQSETLEDAAAIARGGVVLTGAGDPVRLNGADVSASFFDILRVRPVLGRTFRPEENEPGKTRVAILGYGLWQQRFGASDQILGKRITLDGQPIEVIGVMPKGFAYPADRVLWQPIEHTPEFLTTQRASWYINGVGRAKPGTPLSQVTAEVQTIGQQLATKYPEANEGVGMTAISLHEATVATIRQSVWILLGAVGFVLLIACVNVANLLLARAAARESEMAVRTALGAGRRRLVRQLLTESIILSVLGGAFGLLLAVWGVELLISLEPQGVPRLDEVRVDGMVMAFTAALALFTGVLFGLVPAFQATRSAVSDSLKEAGRGAVTSRGGARVRGALVVAEMALAVTLLAGAGLLIRSFATLAAVHPGFDVENALTFELSLSGDRYAKEPQQVSFFDQLLPRLRAIPGVRSAGGSVFLPLSGSSIVLSFEVAGRPPVPSSQQPAMQVRVATPEYFQTIGIPLKRGRWMTDDDRAGTTPVVLITDMAAKQFFPNEDPIGKRLIIGWGRAGGRRAGGEIVGIIGDVKDAGLAEAEPPHAYLPYRQWPIQTMSVVLKTAVPPASIGDAVRREVHAIDPNLPVSNIRTLDQIVSRSISQPRFYMTLLAVFGAVALVLAGIGIFGVLSYAVAQRTREIGIRMALGAPAATVLRLIIRQAMVLAAAGITLGLVAAFYLSETLTTLLFNTSPTDRVTYAAVTAVLLLVALAASYVPARRATRVDPIVALRAE